MDSRDTNRQTGTHHAPAALPNRQPLAQHPVRVHRRHGARRHTGVPGSPGSVSIRRNQAGSEYYVRRHYDGTGTQKETYIGLVGDADAEAASLRERIDEVKAIQKDVRLLIREGFQAADGPSYARLASLHLHGLFAAGATLVGSHAFGILLNQMGVQADAYATEDIDLARREALAFETLPAAVEARGPRLTPWPETAPQTAPPAR